ncbi:integrase/recombinase XerD [Diaminobutyricimonas aerilata]|uniref:Tyrosine recombinase XerD n=1 Tax=Diaminobutyricimonas aerilata TaxID=1162967 RepID=A0A2M9CKN0_9MICO|nr:site-specific tyrosine recombinase XerD [Diaminobutyricimonas aerilata]PJJ72465.1 integrase/recombinase XerD [Diaminobutyricimonas aerilata]
MPDAADPLPEALRRYLRHVAIERGLSQNTVGAYRRDLQRYLDFLAERGVAGPDRITPGEVTAFVAASAGQAATSRARILSSVRGFHRFLVDERLAPTDAASDVPTPKLPSRLPKALTIDQVERLLDAPERDTAEGLRDRALLELMYATGARVSEAVGLTVDDVTAEGGTAEFVRLLGKGGKQRLVPVGSFARDALDRYLVRARPELSARGRASPAVFLGSRGAPLSRQSVWLVIRAAAERAQLGVDVSPHTLRHSFATHLLQGGADVRVVQELLGHASVSTTQIYTLVTADALREVYATAHPRAR